MPTSQTPDGTKVRMSGKELVFGETIFSPRESNDLLADTEALRQRMEEDGYLIIRNFHNREDIMKARKEIIDHMESQGVLAEGSTLEDAIIGEKNRSTRFKDSLIKTWPGFLNIVDGKNTMDFFGRFLGAPALSLDHKWLRAISTGRNAGMHCDIVYMGAGTNNLYTMWTALGDISLDMGPLALCLGSHKLAHLRNTYGASDAHDDLIQGAFSNDPTMSWKPSAPHGPPRHFRLVMSSFLACISCTPRSKTPPTAFASAAIRATNSPQKPRTSDTWAKTPT